jgi:hypothetical protein
VRALGQPSSSAKNGLPAVSHADELRVRQLEFQPLFEQAVDRSQAEWKKLEPLEPLLGKGSLELERRRRVRGRAQGGQHTDRLVAQAAKGNLEHACRGRVEPLHVVERDEDGPVLSEHPLDVENGEPDRVRIRRVIARLHEPERNLERPPTGRHE